MRNAWYVLGGFVLGAATMAILSRHPATDRSVSSPQITAAERELDRIVARIDLDALPFDRAVQDLRKLTTAKIDVDDAALTAEHFDLATPITMHGSEIPLDRILEHLCDQGAANAPIGYCIRDGRIVITSATRLAQGRTLRSYEVRDVLRSSILEEDPDERAYEQSMLTGITGIYSPPRSRVESLIRLIEDTIATDTWKDNGGSVGAIYYFDKRLFVVQNWANHRMVAKLLQKLREPDPAPPPSVANRPLSEIRKSWVLVGEIEAQEAAIRKPLTRIDIDHQPFEATIDTLRHLSGSTIWIDQAELPRELIDQMPPISLHLADAPLHQALGALALLRAGDIQLGYTVEDGIVLITSRDKADRNLITRTYDVRDLIPASGTPGRLKATDALVRLMEDTIETESWKDNGGLAGSVLEMNGRLLVTQTWPTHEKVAMFLEALRSSGTTFDTPVNLPTRPRVQQPATRE